MTNSTPPQRRRQGQDSRYSEKKGDVATHGSRHSDRSDRPDRSDRAGRFDRSDRSDRPGRPDRSDRSDRPGRPDRSDRSDRPGRPERSDRPDRPGRPDRSDRSDRPGRPDRSDRSSRPERSDRSDRSGRSDRFGRPDRFGRSDRPDRPFWGSFDRAPGNARPDFADDADRPSTPRPPRGASIIAEVSELDRDLLKLIARRARLLAKLPARQAGSGNSDNERELRLSWEKNAARISRDPRLIRQLFALLGEVEVAPADMEQAPVFNLAPPRKAMEIDLPAPASDRRVRLAMTLAAGAGIPLEVQDVPLNAAVLECLKTLNQAGANLRWEEDGRILCRESAPVGGFGPGRSGRAGDVLDKVIHVGDDALNFFLLLFLMATRPTRLKIIGEGALKLADFSALRRFLPQVGARLTAVIPGREGLPARLETSAMLPAEIVVPADIPYDAAVALCLCLPFWESTASLGLSERTDGKMILDEVLPLLKEAGVRVELDGERLSVASGRVQFQESPTPGIHLAATATLLAMPAFAGGTTRLHGPWDRLEQAAPQREKEHLDALFTLLRQAGLLLEKEDSALVSRPSGQVGAVDSFDLVSLPAELFPIGLVLSLLPVVESGQGLLPALPEGTDMTVLDDFLPHLGLMRGGKGEADAEQGEMLTAAGAGSSAPFAAPSPEWALALALAAFVRPHAKLSNPGIVAAQAPEFWNIYNTLPAPLARPKAADSGQTSVRPTRRRVFADYMPESERPEPLPYDEDA